MKLGLQGLLSINIMKFCNNLSPTIEYNLLDIIMPQANSERNKIIAEYLNKFFFCLDTCLFVASIVLSLTFFNNSCIALTFVIYAILYAVQTLQHYLIYKFPKIDINKHHVAYRRTVIGICLSVAAYMFQIVTFWQQTPSNPIYCTLCVQKKIGLWIGFVMVVHNIFLIGWAVTLIQAYIARRYYLLALGGFQVQQRLISERARQLNEMMIIEPDTSHYPAHPQKDIYYKFQDVIQVQQQNYECTICLNNQRDDDHFVNAGCGHFYHQICLLQWAQVNSNCPQCRKQFQQVKVEEQKPKQIQLVQYHHFQEQQSKQVQPNNDQRQTEEQSIKVERKTQISVDKQQNISQ